MMIQNRAILDIVLASPSRTYAIYGEECSTYILIFVILLKRSVKQRDRKIERGSVKKTMILFVGYSYLVLCMLHVCRLEMESDFI